MLSKFATTVSKSCPLSEHPRPQFRREDFLCLNGEWDFSISESRHTEIYDKTILVPFAVETPLSGIAQSVSKKEWMHYRKDIPLPPLFQKGKAILHFDAVDQVADVYVNGSLVAHHEGGYIPFSIELEDLGESLKIEVDVNDDVSSPIFPRGKQVKKPGTIWYTPTSGIWGTVWLEKVADTYVKEFLIEPDFDQKQVCFHIDKGIKDSSFRIYYQKELVAKGDFDFSGIAIASLENVFHPWSPESPCLYEIEIIAGEDHFFSYFGMRKFSSMDYKGHRVFALNNKPYFLSGVLDQGYFPDGGLTPPSDQAMIEDLLLLKKMGFNLDRKHIKIEPMRWYYHCDRLGILVMQDIVNAGSSYNPLLIALAPFIGFRFKDDRRYQRFGRGNPQSRARFEEDLENTVSLLKNVTCIFGYTLFNEGWGQFDAVRLTKRLRELDNTRLIDSTSGWFDQGVGDFSSHHIYFRKIKVHNDFKRILSLSEFGGYSLHDKEHSFKKKNFGYAKAKDKNDLNSLIEKLYEKEIIPLLEEGLSCTVYTQLSDVEEETNGLITYDRVIEKVDASLMQKINARLKL